ncbi:MAG: nuclear transport factor 2 family protein, partial [Pyrinomonadaceae bacterium]|nr:nuclear transport factor 2 family protein [Pyrinomonadaceae bacterium]
MKKLIAIATLTILSTFAAFAQNSKDEQEILKIHSSLDQAFLKKEAPVFERVYADDYIYSSPSGKMMNRVETLEDLRKEWANTNYKVLTSTTDDIKVKVSGNMALVTANWTSTTVPPNDANADPHKDTGRYREFMKNV